MNKRIWILMVVALAMMAGGAGLLMRVGTHQKLGHPGVKTHSLPGTIRLQVDLPEHVLNYQSEFVEVDQVTLDTLPKDTSFGQRIYQAPDSFRVQMNVVLMGRDRTSLHKPQFCLTGQGWNIDQARSEETKVAIAQPVPYDLPVVKLIAGKQETFEGQTVDSRALYVYWFVAEDSLSASVNGLERMWLMAKNLVRTGVLQRWAYVSCFCRCAPGQEDAVFERLKPFIAASVPQFQLTPRGPAATITANEHAQ